MGSDPPDRPNRSNRFELLSDMIESAPKRLKTDTFPTLPTKKVTLNNPKFIVISSTDPNKPFTKLSPFAVKKGLDCISTEINSTKLLRDGNLLIETRSLRIAEKFLKTKSLANLCAISCKLHDTLNSVKGTIYAPCLSHVEEKEIVDELKPQGVTAAYKFTRPSENGPIPTGRIVLTFDMLRLPSEVDVAWYKVKVSPYVPNPMRCKNCQKLGHTSKRCRSNATCFACNLPPHNPDLCSRTMCANCSGSHTADDKNCPKYQQLKEILKIKVTEYCSISEARRLYNSRNPTHTSFSYSEITKANKTDKCQTNSSSLNNNPSPHGKISRISTETLNKNSTTNDTTTKLTTKAIEFPTVSHSNSLSLSYNNNSISKTDKSNSTIQTDENQLTQTAAISTELLQVLWNSIPPTSYTPSPLPTNNNMHDNNPNNV